MERSSTSPATARNAFSRRAFIGMGGGAVVGAGLALAGGSSAFAAGSSAFAAAAAAAPLHREDVIANWFAFLAAKFDEHGSGSALRVPQSYTGGFFEPINFVSSFTYDNALMIIAWIRSGDPANVARARLLGDALLYAQSHDPIGDGRTRASYQPNPFITADGSPYIGSPAAYTGNQAWAGMALAHLYDVSGEQRYLDGALLLGNWIHDFAWDGERAPFGYTGGRGPDDTPYTFKATEHNIDVGSFFEMLAGLTRQQVWRARSRTAFLFVKAMYEPGSGHIWTGTNPDGVTTNFSPIPADVQTWAYLATRTPYASAALDWVGANLMVTDGAFHGSSFSDTDVSKVWFEGTAHQALALRVRGRAADRKLAETLLQNLAEAQRSAPNADGRGLVAASRDGLDTGFGDLYYAALHTGATAWALLAANRVNPFTL